MQYKRIEPALRKKHKKQLRVTLATGPLGRRSDDLISYKAGADISKVRGRCAAGRQLRGLRRGGNGINSYLL